MSIDLAPPLPFAAVLFDLGYTLLQFEPSQTTIVQGVLDSMGSNPVPTGEEIHAAVQLVWGAFYHDGDTATFPPTPEYDAQVERELSRRLLTQLGLDVTASFLDTYLQRMEDWFARPGVLRPYPEAVEVLTALQSRGYRLGIVSNWSWNLRQRVDQVGLAPFFEMVWGSAYAGCSKPHPGIFHQALLQMDLTPKQVLYVGDSYRHDIVGARSVGIEAVLVARGDSAHAPENPDCPTISDLRGLLPYLDGRCPLAWYGRGEASR